jgi:hypothetical protein
MKTSDAPLSGEGHFSSPLHQRGQENAPREHAPRRVFPGLV